MTQEKKAHKEVLNRHKVEMLKKAADYTISNSSREIPLSAFANNVTDYTNFQKLRFHALVHPVKRGTWLITSHGWAFLRGERPLSKYVWVKDNSIVAHSDEQVSIRDLAYEPMYVATTVEYEDGKRRPFVPSAKQSRLF